MSRTRRLRRHRRRTKLFRNLLLLTLFSAVVVTLALGISFAEFAKTLPDLKEQAVTKSPETSKLYAADGTLLTDLFVEQNRIIVPLTKVQPHLQNAVVAIEDQRFYTHKGVDAEAIARAALTNFEQGVIAEGGSTITQQYVKNTLIKPHKTLSRKIKEAYLAYQVEKKHSKKDILEKYLNTVYFGVNAYGVETASQTFFGKQAAHLSLAEAALLAGLIKSPNNYSPYTYPERALARRSAVLRRMVQQSYITEAEARLARAEPLTVKPIEQRPVPAKYFVDYVKRLILDDSRYGSTPSQRANFLFKGGLRIYTTLDLEMQAHAEEAANMLDRPDDPSVAIAAVEPSTGYVKALVGGRDFETSKFNLAIQGKRQPGSSFKIFVLASALDDGIKPSKTYSATPFTMKLPGDDWKVVNASKNSSGRMNLRSATVFSVNAVYARLIQDIGPAKVVELAKMMGITTEIPPYPSIALGTVGVSPLEMASGASTLANMGVHNKPLGILKITDAKGRIVQENRVAGETVLDPEKAFQAVEILREVIARGTGKAANIGRPAFGKTGTTNSYRDAWFVGSTPDLAAAVWVGYPQAQIAMKSVRGIRVQGGTFPARIWSRFMGQAVADLPPSKFEKPAASTKKELKNINLEVCADMDYKATEFCTKTTSRYFKPGSEPTQPCPVHQGVKVPDVIGISATTAMSTLKDAGFKVSRTYQKSGTIYSGVVISQYPQDGEVKRGTSIKLVISEGASKPKKVAVPNVIGLSETKARNTLRASGFSVSVQYSKNASESGTVIGQSPSRGVQRTRGTKILIIVATS